MKRILLPLLLMVALDAHAERLAPVANGMSLNDVLKTRGAPLEKDVHEADRVVLWKYADGVVTFKNGKLIHFSAAQPKVTTMAKAHEVEAPIQRPQRAQISQEEVDDIINAIPNDTGKESSNSAPAAVGNPQILSEE